MSLAQLSHSLFNVISFIVFSIVAIFLWPFNFHFFFIVYLCSLIYMSKPASIFVNAFFILTNFQHFWTMNSSMLHEMRFCIKCLFINIALKTFLCWETSTSCLQMDNHQHYSFGKNLFSCNIEEFVIKKCWKYVKMTNAFKKWMLV